MLVDADNILIRAERAMDNARLSADGVPTAALHVFANSFSRHVREERPDRVVVCWDGGRSRFRTELYPGYKANRVKRVEGPDYQRPHGLAKQWLSLSNVPHVERAGWEADDLIAAYCEASYLDVDGHGDPVEVVIISSDHDLLQLVAPANGPLGASQGGVTQVKVATGSSETDRWDDARVREHYRLGERGRLQLVHSLVGDSGDGIPGLPGIGPVKAVKLLAGVGWDWETLMAQFDADEARAGWRDTAELTRRLVDLCGTDYRGMGLSISPPGRFRPTAQGDALWPNLLDFLDRYELRTLRERLVNGELWSAPVGT